MYFSADMLGTVPEAFSSNACMNYCATDSLPAFCRNGTCRITYLGSFCDLVNVIISIYPLAALPDLVVVTVLKNEWLSFVMYILRTFRNSFKGLFRPPPHRPRLGIICCCCNFHFFPIAMTAPVCKTRKT